MAETEQGDFISEDGDLENQEVCETDISQEEQDIPNGTPVKRGRGRPKGSGVKPNKGGDDRPKKRGRPKSTPAKDQLDSDGEEAEEYSPTPRKRGRPKGSPKKLVLKADLSDDDGEVQSSRKRGRPKKGPTSGKQRGRPKKMDSQGETTKKVTDGSKKTPGRPKGSRNKPPVVPFKVENTSGRPTRVHVPPEKLNLTLPRKKPAKPGRPKKGNRGRPRKHPLPPDEELYQPRAWKTLGRPRKHPKSDDPEGSSSPETPRRGRGRPRKSESRQGAHLKKLNSKPKAANVYDGPPRKRGRPKGSFKDKAVIEDSPEIVDENSDQNMEDVHEEEVVSNDPPCEDNGVDDVPLEDDQQNE